MCECKILLSVNAQSKMNSNNNNQIHMKFWSHICLHININMTYSSTFYGLIEANKQTATCLRWFVNSATHLETAKAKSRLIDRSRLPFCSSHWCIGAWQLTMTVNVDSDSDSYCKFMHIYVALSIVFYTISNWLHLKLCKFCQNWQWNSSILFLCCTANECNATVTMQLNIELSHSYEESVSLDHLKWIMYLAKNMLDIWLWTWEGATNHALYAHAIYSIHFMICLRAIEQHLIKYQM